MITNGSHSLSSPVQPLTAPRPARAAARRKVKRYREWLRRDYIAIGMMVAEGKSAGEIAAALETSAANIRAVLHRAGFRLQRKVGSHDLLRVEVLRRDVSAVRALADALELEPNDMLARLIRAAVAEPTLVRNLVIDEAG